jgi:hypothetical protein
MNSIDRYLKIAKDAVIKPSDNIDEKIIKRISHIKKSDLDLLDERFMDYFKKSNSRVYLMLEKIKNNPGAFALLVIAVISIIIAFIVKKYLSEDGDGEENNQLSSSKNETQ